MPCVTENDWVAIANLEINSQNVVPSVLNGSGFAAPDMMHKLHNGGSSHEKLVPCILYPLNNS